MPAEHLTTAQVDARLPSLDGWSRDGETIRKTYEFPSFQWAMQFVQSIGALAEERQHHPDIDIRYAKVTLSLSTHDVGGLSTYDIAFAEAADALLDGI